MRVAIEDLRVRVGGREVVRGVSFEVPSGAVLGLVGANGSGKSSLLRALHLHLPSSGRIRVGEDDLRSLRPAERARRVAVLPQDVPVELAYTVEELVRMGRYPHGHAGGRLHPRHRPAVDGALAAWDLIGLRDRPVTELSGGQRQRALLARAWAQQAPVLVLDEPTNHLDLSHRLGLFRLLADSPHTVLTALHDLDLALLACTHLAVLDAGVLVGFGPPAEVLADAALVRSAFAVDSELITLDAEPYLRLRLPHHPEKEYA